MIEPVKNLPPWVHELRTQCQRYGGQSMVARLLGVNQTFVSRIVGGNYECSYEALGRRMAPKVRAIAARQVPDGVGVARNPRSRGRMWQSMRILRQFTINDIASTASVTYTAARAYLVFLVKSGHVIQTSRCISGGTHVTVPAQYRLARDTGPDYPILHQRPVKTQTRGRWRRAQ